MHGEELRVGLEELYGEALEGEEVDVRVGVEELEVDVDEALLAGLVSARSIEAGRRRRAHTFRVRLVSGTWLLCLLFTLGHGAEGGLC